MEPENGKKVQVDKRTHKNDVKHRKGETFRQQMKELGRMTKKSREDARNNDRQV